MHLSVPDLVYNAVGVGCMCLLVSTYIPRYILECVLNLLCVI